MSYHLLKRYLIFCWSLAVFIFTTVLCSNVPPQRFSESTNFARMTVDEGSETVLVCSAEARPSPTYTWIKEAADGSALATLAVNISYSMRLKKVTHADSGRYRCIVSNPLGALRSKPILFNVRYLRYTKASSREQLLGVKHSFLVLELPPLEAWPALQITWSKNRETITPSETLFISSTGALVLLDLGPSDDGTVFQATQSYSEFETPFYMLFLRGERAAPRIATPVPVIRPENRTIVLSSGYRQEVSFECVFFARPLSHLQLVWYFVSDPNSRPITIADHFKERFTLKNFKRILTITEVELQDAGEFQCHSFYQTPGGFQSTPYQSVSAHLTIQTVPQLITGESRLVLAHFGETKHLDCGPVMGGIPTPRRQWYWNANLIQSGVNTRWTITDHVLTIINVQPSDSGIFQCFLVNEAGEAFRTFWVNVESFPPRILTAVANVSRVEGSTAQLDCTVEGSPQPTIKWYKDGYLIEFSSRVQYFKNGTISFNKSETNDEGLYVCQASNSLGVVNATTQFLVLSRTRIIKTVSRHSTFEVLMGSRLRLPCPTAFDTRVSVAVSWYYADTPLDSGGEYRQVRPPTTALLAPPLPLNHLYAEESLSGSNIFELSRPVELRDTGSYQCRVTSSTAGNDTLTFTVFVLSFPGPVTIKSVQIRPLDPSSDLTNCVDVSWTFPPPPSSLWEQRDQLTGFLLFYRRPEDKDWLPNTYIHGSHSRSTSICDLPPGYSYQFAVISSNKVGTGVITEASTSVRLPLQHPTNQPSDISVFATSSTIATLQWLPPSDLGQINGYQIMVKPLNATSSKQAKIWKANVASASSTLLPDLQPLTTYTVSVAAFNAKGVGEYTPGLLVRTDSGLPQCRISFLNMVSVVTLNRVYCVIEYLVKLNDKPELYTDIVTRLKCMSTSFPGCVDREKVQYHLLSNISEITMNATFDDVIPGAIYHLFFSCRNAVGEVPGGDKLQLRISEGHPGPVRNLRLSESDDTKLAFSWAAPNITNGVLLGFELNLTLFDTKNSQSSNRFFFNTNNRPISLPAHKRSNEFVSLLADSWYILSVAAKTLNGPGIPIVVRVKTGRFVHSSRPPSIPFNLVISDLQSRSLYLGFDVDDKSDLAISCIRVEVQYSRHPDQSEPLWSPLQLEYPHQSGIISQRILVHVVPHTRVRFRLIAMNLVATGSPSVPTDWVHIPPALPGAKVEAVNLLPLDDGKSIKVFWKPIPSENWNGPPIGYDVAYQLMTAHGVPSPHYSLAHVQAPWMDYSIVLTGLEPSTLYSVIVCPRNKVGLGEWSHPVEVVTWYTPPQVCPHSTTVEATKDSDVMVTWIPSVTSSVDIEGYKIFYWSNEQTIDRAMSVDVSGALSNRTRLSDLSYQSYSLQISSYNRMGEGTPCLTSPIKFTPKPSRPGPPMNLHFNYLFNDLSNVTLSWHPPSPSRGPIKGYTVRYWCIDCMGKSYFQNNIKEDRSLGPDKLHYQLTQLILGATYSIKVSARPDGKVAQVQYYVSSDARLPATPSMPQIIVHHESGRISLLWQRGWQNWPVSVRNYTIQAHRVDRYRQGQIGQEWAYHMTVEADTESVMQIDLKDLQPFSTYRFRVCAGGDKSYSNCSRPSIKMETPSRPPTEAPSNLTIEMFNQTVIKVSWNSISLNAWSGTPLGYRVSLFTSHLHSPYLLTHSSIPPSASPNQAHLPLRPGMTGVTWWVQIAALSTGGSGPLSTPVLVHRVAAYPPPLYAGMIMKPRDKVVSLKCNPVNAVEIQCLWSPLNTSAEEGNNILGYKVLYTDLGNAADITSPSHWRSGRSAQKDEPRLLHGHVVVPPDASQVIISNLGLYRRYSFSLAAFNAAGEGPRAVLGNAVATLEGRPGPVTGLLLDEVTMTSCLIIWSPPLNPNGRIVLYKLEFWLDDDVEFNQKKILDFLPKDVTPRHPTESHLQHRLQKLRRNSNYSIRVSACTEIGCGPPFHPSDDTSDVQSLHLVTGFRKGSPPAPKILVVSAAAINPSASGRMTAGEDDENQRYRLVWKITENKVEGDMTSKEENAVNRIIIEAKEKGSEDWVEIEYIRRHQEFYEINYDRLKPRKEYQFRVIAGNRRGISEPSLPSKWIWTPSPREDELYKQWWFLLLVTICAIVVMTLTICMVIVAIKNRRSKALKKSGLQMHDRFGKNENRSFLTVNNGAMLDCASDFPSLSRRSTSPFSAPPGPLPDTALYSTLPPSHGAPSPLYMPPRHHCSHPLTEEEEGGRTVPIVGVVKGSRSKHRYSGSGGKKGSDGVDSGLPCEFSDIDSDPDTPPPPPPPFSFMASCAQNLQHNLATSSMRRTHRLPESISMELKGTTLLHPQIPSIGYSTISNNRPLYYTVSRQQRTASTGSNGSTANNFCSGSNNYLTPCSLTSVASPSCMNTPLSFSSCTTPNLLSPTSTTHTSCSNGVAISVPQAQLKPLKSHLDCDLSATQPLLSNGGPAYHQHQYHLPETNQQYTSSLV